MNESAPAQRPIGAVKNYVSALFGKLGMERRTQAAAYAARIFADHGPPHPPQSAH